MCGVVNRATGDFLWRELVGAWVFTSQALWIGRKAIRTQSLGKWQTSSNKSPTRSEVATIEWWAFTSEEQSESHAAWNSQNQDLVKEWTRYICLAKHIRSADPHQTIHGPVPSKALILPIISIVTIAIRDFHPDWFGWCPPLRMPVASFVLGLRSPQNVKLNPIDY